MTECRDDGCADAFAVSTFVILLGYMTWFEGCGTPNKVKKIEESIIRIETKLQTLEVEKR